MPECPKEIVIPILLEVLNREIVYKDPKGAKLGYAWNTQFDGKGSDCIQCGKCEDVCPQRIRIIDHLKEAASKYE